MKNIFLLKSRKTNISLQFVSQSDLTSLKKDYETQIKQSGFEASAGQICLLHGDNGDIAKILAGKPSLDRLNDCAAVAENIRKIISNDILKKLSFTLMGKALKSQQLETLCLGWGLSSYLFDHYKNNDQVNPALVWPKGADKTQINALLEGIFLLRDLVNIPANDMGPAEIERAVKTSAKNHKAAAKSILDDALLKQNFPLIHTVGRAAADKRRPRLIEMNWGKKSHPKLTIIGKGVAFDTGGLDLKPSQYMRLMKKDMGGAAHALALAQVIMALKLPVQLKLLIPAVENSVSADAFRPGDIIKSRKGLTVENTNTDAEGRLILADAITYACESNPELIIDFATLTGSARAALGPDIPAMFCSDEKTGQRLEKISHDTQDPLWMMPLHDAYKTHIESPIADLVNSAGVPGDLIYSALFLKQFLIEKNGKTPTWIHIDCFAWEQSGKPGRPKGGADTGLRACLAFLEDRYNP